MSTLTVSRTGTAGHVLFCGALFLGAFVLVLANHKITLNPVNGLEVLPPLAIVLLSLSCTLAERHLKLLASGSVIAGALAAAATFGDISLFVPIIFATGCITAIFCLLNEQSRNGGLDRSGFKSFFLAIFAFSLFGIALSLVLVLLAGRQASVDLLLDTAFSLIFVLLISFIFPSIYPLIPKIQSARNGTDDPVTEWKLAQPLDMPVAIAGGLLFGYVLNSATGNTATLLLWAAAQIVVLGYFSRTVNLDMLVNTVLLSTMTSLGHLLSGFSEYALLAVYAASVSTFAVYVADLQRIKCLHRQGRELAEQNAKAAFEREVESNVKVKAYEAAVANLTHDLKTPAAQISGLLELIEEEVRDKADVSREIQMAKASARRLRTMIEDTLDITRLEMGRSESHAVAFNPADMLEKLVTSFRFTAGLRKLELRFVNHLTVVSVLQDGQRLERIVANLIDNAIKYTNEGHVTVTVANTPVAEGRSKLLIEVSDTGIGIPQEQLQNIFSKFERARNHHAIDGLGLGLALVASLVKMLGGSVTVTSQINSGTCFKVVLPCEVLEQASATAAASRLNTTPDKPRILLAEDDPVSRELAGAMLKGMADITYATNGLEAVRKFEKDKFTMVIMDCRMPVMDGPSAVREIRQFERLAGQTRTPILGLTANASPEESRTAITAGMDRLLEKPLSMKLVKELLAS